LAFFIEYLDTSVRRLTQVERAFNRRCLRLIPANVGYLVDEGLESRTPRPTACPAAPIFLSLTQDEKLNTVVVVSAGAEKANPSPW